MLEVGACLMVVRVACLLGGSGSQALDKDGAMKLNEQLGRLARTQVFGIWRCQGQLLADEDVRAGTGQ